MIGIGAVLVAPAPALAQKPTPAKPAKPAAKPADKPAEKPADKPAAKPDTSDLPGDKPASGDSKKGIDEARKRMESGQTAFSQGQYDKARIEFEAAYAAMPYSAFLYNAAFAAEKAGDRERAIAQYEKYLATDPNSPDAPRVRETIDRLKKEGKTGPTARGKQPDQQAMDEIRSLVLIESEPVGAPVTIYERTNATAPDFKPGADNSGWHKVAEAKTPRDVSLKVGHYHVEIEPFQDYKRSSTDLNLTPGHVYEFKANLSQGEFLAFVRVKSNVEGAKVFLDDPPPHKSAPWARTPQGAQVNAGDHELWIEAPGFEPKHTKVSAPHGQQVEVDAQLERVDYGYLVVDGNMDIPDVEIAGLARDPYLKQGDPLKIKVPAGTYPLVLDASGRKKIKASVVIPRGQELPVHATLNPSYSRAPAIALGILAAGGIAGGTALHFQYVKNKADFDDDSVPVAAKPSEDVVTLFNVTRGLAWGVGALFTGLCIFYAVRDPLPDSVMKTDAPRDFPDADGKAKAGEAPDKPKKSATRTMIPLVAPFYVPHAGGLSIGGAF